MKTCLISRRASRWVLPAALALALGLTPLAAQAQTYTDLHNFDDTGGPCGFEYGRLAQGRDGNFYASSVLGGTNGAGTIFALTPNGTVTVIHNLVSTTDGGLILGGLTLGANGNFYGDAFQGGVASGGTVFTVTPSGAFTVLHNFIAIAYGGHPEGALTTGTNGTLYGATNSSIATIYQITPSGTFRTIHTLTAREGSFANQLSLGSDGNLYGGTEYVNGNFPGGTAFKVTPAGVLTVLHTFHGTDGDNPFFGMVQAANGTFYGATLGGSLNDPGSIYSLTSSGTFTLLHSLNGTTDGNFPFGQLLLASDGNLYGTAEYGGTRSPLGCGTIFQVTPDGAFRAVYNFDGIHGCNPYEQVVQGTNGLLYGLVGKGGAHWAGVFYSLDLSLPAFAGLVTPAGEQGDSLGILGQGFSSASVVTFGGVPATSFRLEGGTFISAGIPPGALTGPVTVTTGTTTLSSIQIFKVRPTFASFTPTSGPVGTPVTITGTGLTQATKVSFNGTLATFTVNSDTQITTAVPAGATTGQIGVTTKGGNASNFTTFTVN